MVAQKEIDNATYYGPKEELLEEDHGKCPTLSSRMKGNARFESLTFGSRVTYHP